MQASKRMAVEAPSSSRFELLLLNLQTFALLILQLYCICFCCCCCCCSNLLFVPSSTLDTILTLSLENLMRERERERVVVVVVGRESSGSCRGEERERSVFALRNNHTCTCQFIAFSSVISTRMPFGLVS